MLYFYSFLVLRHESIWQILDRDYPLHLPSNKPDNLSSLITIELFESKPKLLFLYFRMQFSAVISSKRDNGLLNHIFNFLSNLQYKRVRT